jgi:hypothetical protein
VDYQELIDDLKGRINTQYVDCIGSTSYELKQCLDAIESLLAENERLKAELAKYRDAHVVAWVEVIDSYEGPYHFHGQKLLGVGKHKLIVKPGEMK